MNLLELSEQEIIRRNSMEQLRQMGIEPYPAAEYVTNAFSTEIKEKRYKLIKNIKNVNLSYKND